MCYFLAFIHALMKIAASLRHLQTIGGEGPPSFTFLLILTLVTFFMKWILFLLHYLYNKQE